MQALLVVPDALARVTLERILRSRGWGVTICDSPDAAVSAFSTAGASLAVIDCDLIGAGDHDVCRRFRDAELGDAVYVLALVRADDPEGVRRAIDSGADDFLVHPVSPAVFEGRLALAERDVLHSPERTYPRRVAELEERLRVEQASLEELFDSAPEGIAVVDGDDRVLRVNGEFSRMFGYSAAEALGRQINDLIVPEHLQREGLRLTHGVVRGERIMMETVRRHRDGTLIEVSVLATPIRVGHGPIGAYGIYRDITERKAHERALRESEARYRALFDQSPVGVFLFDSDLRITHFNERLPRIVRLPSEELTGFDLHELQEARMITALRDATEGIPTAHQGAFRALRGGPPLWLSIRYAPLRDPDGEPMGGIGVVEDITERERAQQQLKAQTKELERVNTELRDRTAELEAAMRARSRLYSAINHELRTPISSIMLYHELLLSGSVGPLPPDQAQALEQSHTAAMHLLDLIHDVLDLARLEAGKLNVQPVPVKLSSLLRDLRATALPLLERHGSDLRLEIDAELPVLHTDPQRVRQILLNLLSNAAKFGRSRPVVLRAGADGEAVLVEVIDQGIGIAADDLPHLFQEFVQVGESTENGAGLGLAISRRLAELLGARIEVESRLGRGSTFRLHLPAAAGLPVQTSGARQ